MNGDDFSDLTHAIVIAAGAHDGQVDKCGEPYILHPLRVMLAQSDEASRIAAVLHDVVEDTDAFGLGDILAFFGEDVRAAVDALTRRDGEDYFAYVERAMVNPIARRVKIADLNDNMDPSRKPEHDPSRHARMVKYDRALCMLLGKTTVKDAA